MLPVPAESADDVNSIRSLIRRIKTDGASKGYYTAIELAKYKKKAVPSLVEGLASPDAETRKWCARALTNIVGGYGDVSGRGDAAPAGLPLLTALDREPDEKVAWYMVQAIGKILPDSKKAIPILLKVLLKGDLTLQLHIVKAIGEYKAQAGSAKPTLIGLLKSSKDDSLRSGTFFALRSIGMNDGDAEALSKLRFPESGDAASTVLCFLLDYPGPALNYLKSHPGILEHLGPGSPLNALVRVLGDKSPKTSKLRSYLRNHRKDLPSITMVHLGCREYLPMIRARIATADPHSRTFLQACARALGEKAPRVVRMSETVKGSFRPRSAHPGTDPARRAPGFGHGDGSTSVLVTGRLLMPDRSPVIEPRFYHTNDRMLLGEKRKDPAPLIRYDQKTGRFAFLTTVFAAYSMSKRQKEPGPYQTGSALTLITAKGAQPLTVHFYDEMPDVEITLSKSRKDEPADEATIAPRRRYVPEPVRSRDD
jgi:hypothetical protein